ncbi:MAG: DNA-binding PadR family transcriptional regulator [Paraglaciecola sp.]|jgi:DNA-binding PadR family transcriptional regulator|uniref:hypothetical protein n=1 Tax=Polaribacter sp. TaxID=1920175 RepID=UPI003AE374F3|tara:strand:+ start:2270 stop:2473 length:204 start_codon:yes stop_codon:yes gene_type:complete
MIQKSLTPEQLLVFNVIREGPLTSFEILKKVESITMILSLYTIMDELKKRGIAKSFTKENKKYHIAC